MGLDLRLLPFDHDSGDFCFSHTILTAPSGYDIYEAAKELNQLPVPDGFQSFVSRDDQYEDCHYGKTTETPYGERLTYTTVEQLLTLSNEIWQYERPTLAYLKELDPQTKVALYWH